MRRLWLHRVLWVLLILLFIAAAFVIVIFAEPRIVHP